MEIRKFLEEHNNNIKTLLKKARLSYFNATISGKQEDYKSYELASLEVQKFYSNKDNFIRIKELLDSGVEDPILKRQLEIFYLKSLPNQSDFKLREEITKNNILIAHEFNTFRAKIENKTVTDNEIKNVLQTEVNSDKLKKAWEANKKQGEFVEKRLIQLIKLRNKMARSLGFDNFYVMALKTGSDFDFIGEQEEKEVETIYKELEKATNKPFKTLKEEMDICLSKKYKTKELKPWHYQDLFFQHNPDIYNVDLDKFYKDDVVKIADKFYREIGLSATDIIDRSDLYEKEGKYQHAYCIDMDGGEDVRIVMNVKNNEDWAKTTMHELGHGVYSKYVDHKLPFVLRDSAHILTTEGIALLLEKHSKNTSFMKRYCNVKGGDVDKLKDKIELMTKSEDLVFSRWSQVMFNFERELYKDPDQNLNLLWWDLVSKYQLFDFSRDKPDWASKIHITSSPAYYHNYLLGELFALQLHNYIVKNILKSDNFNDFDYSGNKEVGNYLRKYVFEVGSKYKWNEMTKRATGEYLTPRYFIRQFNSN
jgi:peptidyl-dipeptidase A